MAKQKKSEVALNLKQLGGSLLKKMVRGGAKLLRINADEVNKLNVFPVPDGDTGDNMRMTIESGLAAIENMDSDDLAEIMKALSHGMLLGARGNSGVILSQFFAGVSKGLETSKTADPATLGHALEIGVQKAYASVVTPTEGTILTVAREAVEYATARITPESTIRTFFADLVSEMHASLDRTPEILTVLKEAGVVDSGGAGLFYIMDGFNRVLNGNEVGDAPETEAVLPKPAAPTTFAFNKDSEMTFGYCTEFLLQLQTAKTDVENFDLEALKDFLSQNGDSIVAFLVDSIVKVHVHTFTPEIVLGHCRKFGEFLTMKIENMSVQHTELGENAPDAKNEKDKKPQATEEPKQPKKPFGVVAVCHGAGMEELYRELGTDVIIRGGQTHNPSTNEFLEAFAKINAEHILVLPNNGNILMAAGQAANLYEDATIHVVKSKSAATGYVVLSSLDPQNASPEENLAAADEALARVTAGYVSPAIRDAQIGGVTVHTGDTIGIIAGDIVLSCTDRITAACELADKMLALPEKFMLTVFCGKDATDAERQVLEEKLTAAHKDAEIYFIDGGQDIYPYLFAVE
ncbi:MAG: DAK2 domain-containing protein [Ruminococcaceae bacterium]|nr:DAK2 domain-containing protein [Oscillospiraceae bacterium]